MSTNHRRRFNRTVVALCFMGGVTVLAQSARPEEQRREVWQKVDEIFSAMGVRPGATVADIGAGDGFFTARLARAVGPEGRVFAVDIEDGALTRLRKRLEDDNIRNVSVVKGTATDPKLPERTLDAALIVNAYHEMDQHQEVLAAVHRALKPEGRLVIVEPISERRRASTRAEQTKGHEIAPEFVMADARGAGFRIVALQDPFTNRGSDLEWLMALQPASTPASTAGLPAAPKPSAPAEEADPALRVTQEEFLKLIKADAVTIVDVRDSDSYAAGHIPGAISVPLASVSEGVERLRTLGKSVVTYCS